MRVVYADSGAFIALLWRRDRAHELVRDHYTTLREAGDVLLTSDLVVSETALTSGRSIRLEWWSAAPGRRWLTPALIMLLALALLNLAFLAFELALNVLGVGLL